MRSRLPFRDRQHLYMTMEDLFGAKVTLVYILPRHSICLEEMSLERTHVFVITNTGIENI